MDDIKINKVFEELELALEEQIKLVVITFQNISEEQLQLTPNKDTWSISQCIQHLNTYSDYYLPLLEKAQHEQRDTTALKAYKSSRIGNYFVKMIDPNQSSKKLKAIKRHLPDSSIPPHEIISNHLTQQERLLSFIREIQQINLSNKRLIPTSISSFVKLNILDTIRFLIAHNSRHLKQASKLVKH